MIGNSKERKPTLNLNVISRRKKLLIRKSQQYLVSQDSSDLSQKSQQNTMSFDESQGLTGSCDLGLSKLQTSDKFYQKYEVKEKLGEGASGIVSKCIKKDGSGYYAVKITKCEVEHILTLKKTYHFMKMLDHPSIIKYKSIYIACSQHKSYLVMELFDHPHLGLIKFQSEDELKNVVYKILDAVSYMHMLGLCHRDIKPENILYDQKSGQIKIIDFGVSREIRMGRLKKEMMTCTGTLLYKAPELFKGGFYDQLIDQWAVGVTIYSLIAGVTPFYSQCIMDAIENIQKGVLTFSQPVWKQHSDFVKQLIRQLLSPKQSRITAEQAKNNLWFSGHKQIHQSLSAFQRRKSTDLLNISYCPSRSLPDQKSKKVFNEKNFKNAIIVDKFEQSDYEDSDEQVKQIKQ